MSDRIRCVVPFCRRTTGRFKPPTEWVCHKHWPTVSKALRQRRALAKRLLKRALAQADRESIRTHGYISTWRMNRIAALRRIELSHWERCKREAIERAGGIG